jgi:hypothetical protein
VELRDGYIDLKKLEYFGRQEHIAMILQPYSGNGLIEDQNLMSLIEHLSQLKCIQRLCFLPETNNEVEDG